MLELDRETETRREDSKETAKWQIAWVPVKTRLLSESMVRTNIWLTATWCNTVLWLIGAVAVHICMGLCRFITFPGSVSVFCFPAGVLWGIPGQSTVLTFSLLSSQPVSSGCLLRWAPKGQLLQSGRRNAEDAVLIIWSVSSSYLPTRLITDRNLGVRRVRRKIFQQLPLEESFADNHVLWGAAGLLERLPISSITVCHICRMTLIDAVVSSEFVKDGG